MDNSEGQIIHVSLIKKENSNETSVKNEQSTQSQSHVAVASSSNSVNIEKAPSVELSEIDKILEKEDGLIKRGRSNL